MRIGDPVLGFDAEGFEVVGLGERGARDFMIGKAMTRRRQEKVGHVEVIRCWPVEVE